MGSKMCF